MPPINTSFFLLFILAHLIGDFVLQTDKIAALKASGPKGVFIHVVIITLVQVIALSWFGLNGIIAAILCALLHFFIDYMKIYANRYFSKFQFAYFIVDQMMHLGVIIGLTYAFAPNSSILSDDQSYWIKFLISLIVVSYLSSVAIKIFLRDIHLEIRNEVFFFKHERILDAFLGVILFLILLSPLTFIVVFITLSLFIYQRLEKKLYKYSLTTVLNKYFTTALIGFLSHILLTY